jgi:outer membrane protein assembly factor BamD (BamD/ComL family)
MNRVIVIILIFLLVFQCITTCSQKTQKRGETKSEKELTVENLIKEAHAKYDDAIKEGKTKENAVQVVFGFLKSQKNVKEIKATSSDTLRVIFTNNEEVVLFLGRSRL